MPDKELIFKKALAEHLHPILLEAGYIKREEHKGYAAYRNDHHELLFLFERNQSLTYYASLSFADELPDYSLELLISKLKGDKQEPQFGSDFEVHVNEWAAYLAHEIQNLKIEQLQKDSPIIKELRKAFEQSIKVNDRAKEIKLLKEKADAAWKANDYQSFISTLKPDLEKFPGSYAKKYAIAAKRMAED